jgi:hypothetical protein
MYIDGNVVMQGHSLSNVSIVEALRDAGLDITLTQSEMSEEDYDCGRCPNMLAGATSRKQTSSRRGA